MIKKKPPTGEWGWGGQMQMVIYLKIRSGRPNMGLSCEDRFLRPKHPSCWLDEFFISHLVFDRTKRLSKIWFKGQVERWAVNDGSRWSSGGRWLMFSVLGCSRCWRRNRWWKIFAINRTPMSSHPKKIKRFGNRWWRELRTKTRYPSIPPGSYHKVSLPSPFHHPCHMVSLCWSKEDLGLPFFFCFRFLVCVLHRPFDPEYAIRGRWVSGAGGFMKNSCLVVYCNALGKRVSLFFSPSISWYIRSVPFML